MPLPSEIEFQIIGTEQKLRATVTTAMTIGRSDPTQDVRPSVDLVAHRGYHQGVSRRHAIIAAREDSLVIINVSSTNGTAVNGEPLATGDEHPLHDGDEIAMGLMRLQVAFVYATAAGGA
jgi:pSer/pThr/pTyr-binding forkhead associated (FHA) protein